MNKIINTKINFKNREKIKLRNVVFNDIVKIFEILHEEEKENYNIFLEILHNQLIEPKISLAEFKKLPEENLIKIGKVFIENEDYIFKNFKDTGDFYKDFVTAIKIIEKQQLEYIGKIVGSFKPVIEEASQAASRILENLPLARMIEQITRTGENVSRVLEVAGRHVIALNDIYQKWIVQHKHIFENIGKYWTGVWDKYSIAENQATPVLKKYKWFVAPSMSTDIIFYVMQLNKKQGRQDKAINKLFINYFSNNNWQNLEEMVESWNNCPIMRKRLKILKDCVQTLKKVPSQSINISHIILPVLIAQIDGILTDYLNSNNIPWQCNYDDFIQQGQVRRVGRKSQFRINSPRVLTTQLDDIAKIVFLDILFQSSRQPVNTPFNFNRHKIMHGESVKFGRKDYLIRAFMVLDFLAHL